MDYKNPHPQVFTPMMLHGDIVVVRLSYAHQGDGCWHAAVDGYHKGRIDGRRGSWRDVDKKFQADEVKWMGHRIELALAEAKKESIYLSNTN